MLNDPLKRVLNPSYPQMQTAVAAAKTPSLPLPLPAKAIAFAVVLTSSAVTIIACSVFNRVVGTTIDAESFTAAMRHQHC